MKVGTDNFYILLELGFDPPETDSVKIKAALHRKKQEWTRDQENPAKRSAALRCLGLVPEIERVMLDDTLRAQQAKAAKKLREEMLRQLEAELRVLESKGYLLPKEVTALAVKYKAYGVDREKVEERARCPVGNEAPAPKSEAVEAWEALDPATARNVQRNLEVLGIQDLYAFLGEAHYASIKKLQEAAKRKLQEAGEAGSKTPAVTATGELAGLCISVFENVAAKRRYDRYLKISRYPALNQLLDEENARSKFISPTVLVRMVNFAVEKYGVKVLDAEEYIRAYCAAAGIPVDTQSQQVPCPHCGKQVPRDGLVCTSCAAPLAGECPGCGTPFAQGPSICAACGFPLGEMGEALQHLDDAQNALIENNWGTAQRNLQYARKYWPDHPRIEPLEKRARTLEDSYARYVDNVADCVRHNQYYAALELVEEAEARRVRLPMTTVEHVRGVVADFELKVSRLANQRGEPPFEQILELARQVEDSMELSRMMASYPPEPPDRLKVVEQGRNIRLSWGRSPSAGLVDYVLVRKEGETPLTAFDGEILYDGPANSFADTGAQALREYYYNLFVRRSGTYSQKGASYGPVLIIPELEGVQILPNDHGARLSWTFNPDIREVVIWRKLGGDKPTAPGEGIRLETERIDGYSDRKIKNDVIYWYYLVAVYHVQGREIRSQGVCESVTPRKLVAPIEDLNIAATGNQEDEYVVNWQSTEYNDVLLLASPKKPELRSGDVLSVEELLTRFRKLELEMRQQDSAKFRHAFSGGMYIFAAAPFGRFATIGQSYFLTNVPNVENPAWEKIGNQLFLNMKWPQDIGEIVVAYRFDRFPQSMGEPGTTVVRSTRDQYNHYGGVEIPDPEPALHYAKIYSVYLTPEGEKLYSPGVELQIDNAFQDEIFYSFQYKKRMLSRQATVSITVTCGEPATLPKAVFVGKIGRLPLSKNDGMPLFEVEKETRIKGEVTYQYNTAQLPKDLYIRMFLYDDNKYRQLRLLPLDNVQIT